MAEQMILRLAEYHSYNERGLSRLKDSLDKPITLKELSALANKVDIAIAESTEDSIFIRHPNSW